MAAASVTSKNPVANNSDTSEMNKVNELLKNTISIKILDKRSTWLRLDVLPFIFIDTILVIMYYIALFNDDGYIEIPFPNKYQVMGVMVAACIVHLFTFLIRMWSVNFDAMVGYQYCGGNGGNASSLKKGTHVLVTPPPNKGNQTICTI